MLFEERLDKIEREIKEMKEYIKFILESFEHINDRLDSHGLNIKEHANEIRRLKSGKRFNVWSQEQRKTNLNDKRQSSEDIT